MTASLTMADDQALGQLIASAQRRLVLMAPGYSQSVARIIADGIQRLPIEAITIIVDVDPEVFRLGYGEVESLSLLERALARAGGMLHHHPGVRIGLVISDDTTLLYAPTPLLVETSPDPASPCMKPNAVKLSLPPAEVESDLGAGPDGLANRTVGLDKAQRQQIEAVERQLQSNPPQKFDLARLVRAFNAFFEFVEFELKGTFIDRKSITLPSHLMGVLDEATQHKLKASFRLLEPTDELSGRSLFEDRHRIARRYLRSIPGHGAVILRKDKEAFLADVKHLEQAVRQFAETLSGRLQATMDASRKKLHDALLPIVRANPPAHWTRSCLFEASNEECLPRFLDQELATAFGDAHKIIRHMAVRCVFKGVTYELLQDTAFIESVREAIPEVTALYTETQVAPVIQPATTD